MRRRKFITLLGGAAAAWPLRAHAEEAAKFYTIGVLVLTAPNPDRLITALRHGLREAGYIEGRNLRLEIRTADAKPELLAQKAADLVRIQVDVIVAFSRRPRWQPSRRRARFRSSWRRAIRLRPESSRAWPDRAATSRGCRAAAQKSPERAWS